MKLLARWPDLRLHRKGLIVVAVPAAATLVIACATYVMGSRAADAEQSVNHTLRVEEEIQRLKYSEVEGSTHVRGYFLTGEEASALQARESLAAFDLTRQKLFELTGDNPAQTQRLVQIEALERSRVEGMTGAMTRFKWGALPREQLPAVLKGIETERLEMQTILTAMEQDENRLLVLRQRRLESLLTNLRASTVLLLTLGVAGGVVLSVLFHWGVTDRIGKLQKNVAQLATSGVLDPLPHGRDEIGALSEGVAGTAEILRRRTAAVEQASHGVAEVDAAGRYMKFNRVYGQLTGLGEVGSAPSVADTAHPEDRDLVREAVRRMHECGGAEVEIRVIHSGGRVAYLKMTLVPVSADRECGYFVFLHDINRRKEVEAALVQARDAALASNLAKSQFLAKISHDIRTPLSAILGAADLLSQSPLNSDQAGYVGMSQRNCRRLVALINDFLDFSKIEAGVVHVENVPYRVQETVEEAMATFRESAYRKGLALGSEIGGDVPEWELGDPLRVHQVLLNLLGNAIKFTQHGRVDVNVQKIAGADGPQLRFTISDTGPGIRAEDQQRVFALFEQSGKQDLSSRDGCGLGLTICRQLVELMGGTIGLNSVEGSGSTFHFSLPLVAARPGHVTSELSLRPSAPSHEASHEVPRVLVAEDTEDNRLLLGHYLRGEAVEVHFAEDGQQAVDAVCGTAQFDLVLMDLDMPVLDGLGAVKAIRAWETEHGNPPVPIVGLSANAMREAVRECLDAGCAAHVAKPVDKATLLSTIRRYHRSRVVQSHVSVQVAALVPKYLASKLQQIEEARASLDADDFEPIRRFGHNLKGTGVGYGFPRISAIGAEIEESATGHDKFHVEQQLKMLHQVLVAGPATASVDVEVSL